MDIVDIIKNIINEYKQVAYIRSNDILIKSEVIPINILFDKFLSFYYQNKYNKNTGGLYDNNKQNESQNC